MITLRPLAHATVVWGCERPRLQALSMQVQAHFCESKNQIVYPRDRDRAMRDSSESEALPRWLAWVCCYPHCAAVGGA